MIETAVPALGQPAPEVDPITFEVVKNRLVAITEEMRTTLQSVSGSPTVTEASDFFTGLFTADGRMASMGFQVAFQAPVCGQFIRHIQAKPGMTVRDGDMFIGNDPYIAALHQNDVQIVGPIFAAGRVIAWAGVEAHETDVGGMDFASWSPRAREIWQEGMRIPCVKIMDRGEFRADVNEMILAASRLPEQLGLDIRAFIATINTARTRVGELVAQYGAEKIGAVADGMIAIAETRMRARLAELPDGAYRATDFLEHDGEANRLYKLDVVATKAGERLVLDFSGSSGQAPGFINCTHSGLLGAVAGSVLPVLGWDIQWNQGILNPVEVIAPEGLICTAKFPAPVGSATVEAIWVTANTIMLALNRMLMAAPRFADRAQGVNCGSMATFNMGGVNQYGEPFGLHLMDPLAGGSAAYATRDGVDAGGPITSPVSIIADVERNEQVAPLFYLHRRLEPDTGGAGRWRGGLSASVALTLGGIDRAMALVMAHGVEVPNGHGLSGGFPGSTVTQGFIRGGVADGVRTEGETEVFGPKPGGMPITANDVFHVIWQGGGGWGDPLARDPAQVAEDVRLNRVSARAAHEVYGVVLSGGSADMAATEALRAGNRRARVGGTLAAPDFDLAAARRQQPIGDGLILAEDAAGWHVVTSAGALLVTGSTRWRGGAVSRTARQLPEGHRIRLHADLAATQHYCPASGRLLAVDIHRADEPPPDDMELDLAAFSGG